MSGDELAAMKAERAAETAPEPATKPQAKKTAAKKATRKAPAGAKPTRPSSQASPVPEGQPGTDQPQGDNLPSPPPELIGMAQLVVAGVAGVLCARAKVEPLSSEEARAVAEPLAGVMAMHDLTTDPRTARYFALAAAVGAVAAPRLMAVASRREAEASETDKGAPEAPEAIKAATDAKPPADKIKPAPVGPPADPAAPAPLDYPQSPAGA